MAQIIEKHSIDENALRELAKQLKILRESLALEKGTTVIPFSAVTRQGRDEIWELMEEKVLEDHIE